MSIQADEYTETYRIQKLSTILMTYAPNSDAIHIVKKMIDNGASAKDYILALSDGLRYGNWPWTTYQKVESKATSLQYVNGILHYHNCAIFSNDVCNCGAQ